MMRRSDREVTDFGEMIAIMEDCDVCRLALNGEDGVPYILPLNFGMRVEGGRVELFFHGATSGTKYALIGRDPRASFEMDCGHALVTDPKKGSCSMNYRSVIGQGRIAEVPESEKIAALRLILSHYRREDFPIVGPLLERTRVLKLTVERMSGKERLGPA